MVPAGAAPGVGAGVDAAVAVRPQPDLAVECLREVAGDDVDDAGRRLGPVEQALAALQHLDPVDHRSGQRVGRAGGGVEAVVDTYAVDQPEHVAGARALERYVHVAEGAATRGDVQAGDRHPQRLACIQVAAVADGRALKDRQVVAVSGELQRQRLFEAVGGDQQFVHQGVFGKGVPGRAGEHEKRCPGEQRLAEGHGPSLPSGPQSLGGPLCPAFSQPSQ